MESKLSYVVYDGDNRPVMMVAANDQKTAVEVAKRSHPGANEAMNAYDVPLEDLQRLECIANITFIGVTMRMMQEGPGRIQLAH